MNYPWYENNKQELYQFTQPDKLLASLMRLVDSEGVTAFERTCCNCKIYFILGEHEKAGDLVQKTYQEFIETREFNNRDYNAIFSTLIVCQSFSMLTGLLSYKYKTDILIYFSVSKQTFKEDRIYITFNTPKYVLIELDQNLYCTDKIDVQILWIGWILPVFIDYARTGSGDNGTVLFSNSDDAYGPGLAMCSNRPDCFLIPDNVFVPSNAYAHAKDIADKSAVPWEERAEIGFWRGSTTGQPTNVDLGWRSLPRIQLCAISREFPEMLDAGISSVIQISDPDAEKKIISENFVKRYVPATEFGNFKYQIDIDGNTNSWPGLFQKLLTGSPVLKVESYRGFRQWYYNRLVAWVNYVPVARDMSDLIEKIEWLKSNDKYARDIGARGRQLALSMSLESELEYARKTISAAVRYFSFRPEVDLDFFGSKIPHHVMLKGLSHSPGVGLMTIQKRSFLSIPVPIACDDFQLTMKLSPWTIDRAHKVAIIVNNRVHFNGEIHETCLVSMNINHADVIGNDRFEIHILTPEAPISASIEYPLDTRHCAIVLQDIKLIARSALYDTASEISEFHKFRFSKLPNLETYERSGLLMSHDRKVICADIRSGRLHAHESSDAKSNIRIYISDDKAVIVLKTPGGVEYCLSPVGVDEARSDTIGNILQIDDCPLNFELRFIDGLRFALKRGSFFMCCESSGDVTLSRTSAGLWETFGVV